MLIFLIAWAILILTYTNDVWLFEKGKYWFDDRMFVHGNTDTPRWALMFGVPILSALPALAISSIIWMVIK